MSALDEIAEARASALSLRASAKACAGEQGALKFRLTRAAESLDVVVLIAVRGIDRIEVLEVQLAMFERLMRRAVDQDHDAFDSGGAVDNKELLAWFSEWRQEALTSLHQLAKVRAQGVQS